MDWKKKIPGTFGTVDLIFCTHSSDTVRAIELLKDCYENDVSLDDLLNEMNIFLKSREALDKHIEEQIELIKKRYEPWLD